MKIKKRHSPSPLKVKTILIVGPMTISKKILKILEKLNIEITIYVDGGLKHKKYMPKTHFIHTGDGDSSTKKPSLFKKNQNISDLSFTIDWLLKKHHSSALEIHYLFIGFKKGRFDHELLCLGSLFSFETQLQMKNADKKNRKHRIFLEFNVEIISSGANLRKLNGIFSVISLTQNAVKISGDCLFPLNPNPRLDPLSSIGLSNVGSGDVYFESEHPFILYTKKTSDLVKSLT